MWPYKHIGFVLLVSCMMTSALSQENNLSFRNFTEKEGLSDNDVHSFYQDSRGYLWICTNEGLNRYDGFTFKKFYSNNQEKSLPSNVVYQADELIPGKLLITTSNGIALLNMLNNTFEPVNPQLSGKSCNYIFKDSNKSIIMCYSDGIAFLNEKMGITKFINSPSPVINLHRLRSGELLAATQIGYYMVNESGRTFTSIDNTFKISLPHYLIFSVYDSTENILYTSEWSKGLTIIDLNDKKVSTYKTLAACKNCSKTDIVYWVYKDSLQKLWIGSREGLFVLNNRKGVLENFKYERGNSFSLVHDMVIKIYQDGNNNLWFGTMGGVSMLNKKAQHIIQYKQELLADGMEAELNGIIRGRDNNIYISTYGNGIIVIDEKDKSTSVIGKEFMPFNWSVSTDKDKIIATGHDKKIYSYTVTQKKIVPLKFLEPYYKKSNLLLFSFTKSNGDKWYSLNEGGGLVRYAIKENKFYQFTNKDSVRPFSESYFSSIAEDYNGDLWFGMNRSTQLIKWISNFGKFQTINFRDIACNAHNNFAGITDLLIDRDSIWIATSGTGILLFVPSKMTISRFTINESLAGDVVNSIVLDNKRRIWAFTSKGVSCLIPGQTHFITFTALDGLTETYFNERTRYFDSVKNLIYVGARNSLIFFNPDDLLQDKGLSMRACLDGIKVNGENFTYLPDTENVLNYDQNNIQFNFSVVYLSSASGIDLYYKLAGADNDWIKAEDQRTASYINLPAGKYSLYLKVMKSGMPVIVSSMPVTLTIRQAWWRTRWFRMLLILGSIGILYLVVRMYYRNKLEHQQIIFEKKQAVEQERNRIATDMHDDLGAGLTGIKFLSENIVEQNISPQANQKLEKLKGSANQLIESMGEIIWAMNEKNNTLQDLLFHLRSYSITYCEENLLSCNFKLPENIGEQIINGHTRRNIFLIVKECLHNIVKHSKADSVDFNIRINKKLIIQIQDNGSGFLNRLHQGNGIINMNKRSREMQGSLHIENHEGTLVTLEVPLNL